MARVNVEVTGDEKVVVLSVKEWALIIGLLANFAEAMELFQVKKRSEALNNIRDLLKRLSEAMK